MVYIATYSFAKVQEIITWLNFCIIITPRILQMFLVFVKQCYGQITKIYY